MSAFVTSQIVRLFINTMTPDVKYFRRNMNIFWPQLETPLSQEKKHIFSIFDCISEMCMKFKKFWKKKEYPSLIITEIIASERDIYLGV